MLKIYGWEATKLIRKNISKDLPIIGLSASVLDEDKEEALKCVMNDYLEKPIYIAKLYTFKSN